MTFSATKDITNPTRTAMSGATPNVRFWRASVRLLLGCGVLLYPAIATASDASIPANITKPSPSISEDRNAETKVDISPLPPHKGAFVSIGPDGKWRKPPPKLIMANTTTKSDTPKADCSRKAIIYYAQQAPSNFKYEKKGLLYGVRTHTPATRVGDMPGYNSCALVVYAIMKKAGCKWIKYSASAEAIYNMAYNKGWRPTPTQEAGCLVVWNSITEGPRGRIGKGVHKNKEKKGVLYRHLGITTGTWMAVDNTSFRGLPEPFITTRPFRYEPPMFLCPPKGKNKTAQQKDKDPKAQKDVKDVVVP